MTPAEQQKALHLYEQLHDLLLKANKLDRDDVERFSLSIRYFEIRHQLEPLVRKHLGPL